MSGRHKQVVLGEIAISKGLQTGPFGSQLKAEEYTDVGIPVIMPKDIFIEKYLNLAVIGIRDGKPISIPDFLSIKIPVPPLEEKKEIAETLSICQRKLDLLKQLAEKNKTQKRGLMQKMLTGEWRIHGLTE